MKIAVIYDTWDQVSPDAFTHNEHILEATEQTTISDLLCWQSSDDKLKKFKALFEKKDFRPMRIVKMD